MLLLDGLDDAAPAVMAVLPPGSGTIPAVGDTPALTFKPVENARGLYTLYGYWPSSNLGGSPLYYAWSYDQTTPRLPTTPPPPAGQFQALDAARAAMVAHLSLIQPVIAQTPAPAPIVVRTPVYLPAPTPVQPSAPAVPTFAAASADLPEWAKNWMIPAAVAGGIAVVLMLAMRRK